MTDDNKAVTGLKQLGLSTYEARVFVALHKLGTGTASEISSVVEVPRSQVSGAAEGLEELGLVETQQSTPTTYRPVPLQQAREQLLDQLARTGEEAFDYLERVKNTHEAREKSESIWLISARDAIVSRTVDVAAMAEHRLLYGVTSVEYLEDDIVRALEEASERGVTVVVASAEPTVLEVVPDSSPLITYRVPAERDMDVDTGRVLLADEHTVLLSTHSEVTSQGHGEEVAFWTSENPFASVLVELVSGWLREPFP